MRPPRERARARRPAKPQRPGSGAAAFRVDAAKARDRSVLVVQLGNDGALIYTSR